MSKAEETRKTAPPEKFRLEATCEDREQYRRVVAVAEGLLPKRKSYGHTLKITIELA